MKPQIWFYDNKQSNAPYRSNDRIKFIKVADSGEKYNHTKLSDCFKHPDSRFLREKIPYENIDVYSGVTADQLYELIENADKGLVEAVVFDWDRTLTKIEGFWNVPGEKFRSIKEYKKKLSKYNPEFEGFDKMSDKLIMELYFNPDGECIPEDMENMKRVENRVKNNLNGSNNFIHRPTWIAWALNELKYKKIPVFILSNNAVLDPNKNDGRGLLRDFLKKMGVSIPLRNIIYNDIDLPYPKSKYKSRKEYIIMEEIPRIMENPNNNRRSKRRNIRRDMYKKTKRKGLIETVMGYFF